MPSPLLIVFGLNGSLLQRARPVVAANISAPASVETHTVGIQKVFVRPGARAGVARLVAAGHSVGVWSATTMKNTEPMLQAVFGDFKSTFKFVWSRDHTVPDTYRRQASLGDSESDHATLKDISHLWDYSVAGPGFGPTNPVVVDDEPSKARRHADNFLWLPTYSVEDTAAAELDPSLGFDDAVEFLLGRLSAVDDVRTVLPERVVLDPVALARRRAAQQQGGGAAGDIAEAKSGVKRA